MSGLNLALLGLAFLIGCTSHPNFKHNDAPPTTGDRWFAARASALGTTIKEARRRDQELPDEGTSVPDLVWDPMLINEVGRLWKHQCALCHGAQGTPPKELSPRPKRWSGIGPDMGFFFGGDRMRMAIFKRIKNSKGKSMPAFGHTLSREQIWGLVTYIESL